MGQARGICKLASAHQQQGKVMSTQKWEVLLQIGMEYENVWGCEGEPEVFDSLYEADQALEEYLQDCAAAYAAGDLRSLPDRSEFIISPKLIRVDAS